MFKNYLKIAFRNLLKNKVVSLVNIGGLAIGMSATFLLLMYVNYEFSYDAYHDKADRIYRLVHHRFVGEALEYKRAKVFPEIGLELEGSFGEIEESARIFSVSEEYDPVFLIEDQDGNVKKFNEPSVFLADSSVVKIFDLTFIHGSPETFLQGANQLALTESAALKFFGSTDVLDKSLDWVGQGEWRVTAVVKDMPANSHFHFSILASWFDTYGERSLLRWDGFYTYVLLRPGTDIQKLHEGIQQFTSDYLAPYNQERNINSEIHLQPLTDIHLHSHLKDELDTNNNYKIVYALFFISLIILLIALINYINLSTVAALDRAREIGIRKTIGSSKRQLLAQFLLEALVVNALALALSVTLVQLTLPLFNSWLGMELSILHWSPYEILSYILVALIFLVSVSGYYPAMVLASVTPSRALIGPGKPGPLKNTLIIFQFSAAIILSISAVVIHYQIEYMKSRALGININDVLIMKSLASVEDEHVNDSLYVGKLDAFKQLVKSNAGIRAVTVSSNVPGTINSFFGRMRRKEGGAEIQSYLTRVDEEFARVMDWMY
ncbi:putative FtsX-related transmembrane transport protein [Fulvivirga imtechensis AK7]|uniref:Putative FtsX-related transmembrane transport protein n=1 Tax=Fulvivirga imtechensis AK7 TaxID=1237149 RepID=L8JYR2_9BACT|nr:ABC transporter permease [Fulvivirga imtechensis]ELR73920.1 putative FtsX-related transmembrane transport protein [Fulvivirga imtechensis AK7]